MGKHKRLKKLKRRIVFYRAIVFVCGTLVLVGIYYYILDRAGIIENFSKGNYYFSYFNAEIYLAVLIGFAVYAGFYFPLRKPIEKTKEEIHKTFIMDACSEIFENVQHSFEPGLNQDLLDNSRLIKKGNIYYSNDLVTASYQGISFQMSDVLIREECINDVMMSETITIFRGQWFIFKLDYRSTAYLRVSDAVSPVIPREWEKIELENNVFNDLFHVYASHAEEAKKILTEQAMEKVLEIKSQLKDELVIGIVGDELHLAINSNNYLFDYKTWEKSGEPYQKELISRLRLLVSIVEELDLTK